MKGLWKKDIAKGYIYCIDKNSPYANSQGKVYQHVHVMAEHIGRKPYENEVVHHKDRNRENNDISNLMLLTKEEHARLHAIEDLGYEVKEIFCKVCNKKMILTKVSEQIFCSQDCTRKSRQKFDIGKEELTDLVWSMSTVKVAKLLGVSDVAVAKRCKKLGIEKPPRGYWSKQDSSKN